MKRTLILVLAGLCLTIDLRAQDAKAVLEAASAALGAGNLRSLEFSGRGSDGIFGQPYDDTLPWPRFSLPNLTMTIDFTTPALRDDRRRQQLQNPPLGGGFQPLVGEQRQIWLMSGSYAWDMAGDAAVPAAPERDFRSAMDGRLAQIWLTPQGFVKAALANGATARTETIRGARKTIVSFTGPNKMKFDGVINDQNLVEGIETWFGSPVLGDTKVEAVLSNYKDFGGVKFPTHIVQRNGGYPVLDLTVTNVKPNVPVAIDVPANIRQAPAPAPAAVQAEKVSDGIWFFPGNAKTVAIEFKDHIVAIEAPETEARSIMVIDAIKRTIPGKPIRYLINTHHHFDHSGGLRTYAAEGATIVTQQANVAYFQNVWRNPRSINPDRLAKSGRTPVFEGVVGSRVMSDGSRELDIYHYAGNMHNVGMLMIYLPREKMLIEADSWTPPANKGDLPGGVANLVHFVDAVDQLQLDVEQVLPIHGRPTSFAEVRESVGTYGNSQYLEKVNAKANVEERRMAILPGTDSHVSTDARSDAAIAYALFRLTFGINIMMRGIVRIALGSPAFIGYMLKQFENVPVMPPAFLVPFATVLPYIETVIGLCILLGFQTRLALIAGSLMIAALVFGTMMRQDFTIAWLQLDYSIAFFLLLALRSWNTISIDGMRGRS